MPDPLDVATVFRFLRGQPVLARWQADRLMALGIVVGNLQIVDDPIVYPPAENGTAWFWVDFNRKAAYARKQLVDDYDRIARAD